MLGLPEVTLPLPHRLSHDLCPLVANGSQPITYSARQLKSSILVCNSLLRKLSLLHRLLFLKDDFKLSHASLDVVAFLTCE